jgi:membrane protease YdiL (CAAX protease family)
MRFFCVLFQYSNYYSIFGIGRTRFLCVLFQYGNYYSIRGSTKLSGNRNERQEIKMLTTEKLTGKQWAYLVMTLLMGMSITLVRVVIPTHSEITPGLVILETVLELAICAFVVLFNRKDLKEQVFKKFTGKNVLNIVAIYAIVNIAIIILGYICIFAFKPLGIDYLEVNELAPAAVVGTKFQEIFPAGVILTQCITAPICEEIVFRFAFRKVFKDNVLGNILYVLIPSLLFGFIHTASFATLGILYYFFYGCLLAGVYLIKKDIRLNIGAHILANVIITVGWLIGGLLAPLFN